MDRRGKQPDSIRGAAAAPDPAPPGLLMPGGCCNCCCCCCCSVVHDGAAVGHSATGVILGRFGCGASAAAAVTVICPTAAPSVTCGAAAEEGGQFAYKGPICLCLCVFDSTCMYSTCGSAQRLVTCSKRCVGSENAQVTNGLCWLLAVHCCFTVSHAHLLQAEVLT